MDNTNTAALRASLLAYDAATEAAKAAYVAGDEIALKAARKRAAKASDDMVALTAHLDHMDMVRLIAKLKASLY